MINYTFSGVISLSFNWHSELCPVEDSAFHIIHLKALLLHFQAGTMTSTSASAVDVIGAGFIELFDSVEVRSARNPHNKILSIIYVRVKQKEEKPVLSKVRRGGKRKKDADAEEE